MKNSTPFYASITQGILCMLCFFSLFFTSVALAQDIYLSPSISPSIWSDAPITLHFEPHENLCRQAYGEDWKKKCTTWLGKSNSSPQGLQTSSSNHHWPEGSWTWISPTELRFSPTGDAKNSWKSNTTYTVDVSGLTLPARVQLSTMQPSFTTLPLSAYMDTAQVWIDPSPKAEHGLSFSMRFSQSLSEETRKNLEKNAWPTAPSASGLQLSKGTWIWLDNNTRGVVNARILTLPKQKSTVSLSLPHIRPLWFEDGKWHHPPQDAVKELVVFGTDSLFNLEYAQLETWQNKALQMEQHLVFRFSQRVAAEELLQALTVVELPEHRLAENVVPSVWTQGGISQEIRQNARKLSPERVRIPGESLDILRFRINGTPGKYILWHIEAGFGPTNDHGIKTPLAHSLEGVESIALGKPRLDILQAGTVLMQQSNLALVSEHVDSIRWSAHRFMDTALALPFLHFLDMQLPEAQRNATATVARGEIALPALNTTQNAQSYTSAPVFSTLLAKDIFGSLANGDQGQKALQPGLVYVHLEGIKDGKVVNSRGRMLMHSQMSLVLKHLADGSMQAYVCHMHDAKPLDKVRIEVIGFNGLPIVSALTDATGKAVLPDFSNFTQEKSPVAVVARRSTQSGWGLIGEKKEQVEDMLWISLQDHERSINLSNFADITGKQSSTNTLNAFIFAERGLFRPGENLNFGTLLRANDWKFLPPTLPLVAIIHDEVGRKVFEQPFKAQDNIHSFSWHIPQQVLTGRYTLTIATPSTKQDSMGLVLGTHSVQVENFLPDTLRISTQLMDIHGAEKKPLPAQGWLITDTKTDTASQRPAHLALQVQLDTLFGQVAAGRRVNALMYLRPAYLSFAGYEDYTFQDVSPYFAKGNDPITRPLKSSITDAKGQALIPLDFSQWRFGTLQCDIETQGFEAGGGRAVLHEQRFLLSPLPYMLGYKAGQGAKNINFILQNSAAVLNFQTINAQLQPLNPGAVNFSIARRQTVQSLTSDATGQYAYVQTPLSTEIASSRQHFTSEGVLNWTIPTQDVGEYVLTITSTDAGEQSTGLKAHTVLAHIPYSIVGNDDIRPALKDGYQLPQAHLHIKTDKEHYAGGETAQIMLTAPYDGVALISLERDSVAAHSWVKVKAGTGMHSLPIPQDFSGRAYIQVLMGRSANSEAIFIQPQSVALASITVNTHKKEVPLQITAPSKALPGKPLPVHIKNTAGKAVQGVIFAVDEGILQLSKFATPKPLEYLLLDRALEVRTAQLFDRLMPKDSQIMQRLSAFGGGSMQGADFSNLLGTFQNPFKRKHEPPMTWWSGVVTIPAEGLSLEIPLPEYFNGMLRLMAVAHNAEAVGHAQSHSTVQDDQVLMPQLPSAVALGDSFTAGLSISNTTDKDVILRTNVSLDAQSQVQDMRLGKLAQEVRLAPKEEKYLPFQIQAGQEAGEALLRFSTEDAEGIQRVRTYPLSVRPAVLPRYSEQNFMLQQSTEIHTSRALLPYAAKNSISLSPLPLPLVQSALNYLHNYPYNCVEQSISKALPLVLLHQSPLAKLLKAQIPSLQEKAWQKTLEEANQALVAAFNPEDGISMWTDWSDVNTLLTAYAADYVLALQEARLPVPVGLMPQLFITLERRINESPESLEDLRALAYASWVLARAGYVVSKQLELCENYIRQYELQGSDVYHSLMAGAYAALYMNEEAQKHVQKALGLPASSWQGSSDMLDTLAQYGLHAKVLAKHFPKEFKQSIGLLQQSLLEGLNKPHATLGASMAAAGLIHMVGNATLGTDLLQGASLACGASQKAEDAKAELFPHMYTLNTPNCTRFDVTLPAGLAQKNSYFAHVQSYGYDAHMPSTALAQGISVQQSMSLSHNDEPLGQSIVQGQMVRVDVDIRLLSGHENHVDAYVAVAALLPGGFELVLDHEDDTPSSPDMQLQRQEDRVIAFVKAQKNAQRITYHLRAVTQGRFALPAVQAEGLFDTSLQGHTVGGEVRVLAP